MLLLAAFLLIGSVRAFKEKCPETCYEIKVYSDGQDLGELASDCARFQEFGFQLTTTCDWYVRCRQTVLKGDVIYDGLEDGFQLQYIDRGCGETEERCRVMKENLKKILEKDFEGLEYSFTLKSCENYS